MIRKILFSWKKRIPALIIIILGYFLCITFMSMMINQIIYEKRRISNLSMGNQQNYALTVVRSKTGTNFNDDIIRILDKFAAYGKIDILKLNDENISMGKNIAKGQVSPTLFYKRPDWTPSVVKGRYTTVEESRQGLPVIMLGYDIADKLNADIGDTVSFYDKNYKVIGILGVKYSDSQWNHVISMSLKSLPKEYLNVFNNELVKSLDVNGSLVVKMLFRVKQDDYVNVVSKLQSDLDNSSLEILQADTGTAHSDMTYLVTYTLLLSVPIVISALFNVINISYFWIMDRKKEITIKKALGATNKLVIRTVRFELLSVAIASTMLSFVVQVLLEGSLEQTLNKLNLGIQFSWVTFSICMTATLGIGYLTTLLPTEKILSMEPAEALRYE